MLCRVSLQPFSESWLWRSGCHIGDHQQWLLTLMCQFRAAIDSYTFNESNCVFMLLISEGYVAVPHTEGSPPHFMLHDGLNALA